MDYKVDIIIRTTNVESKWFQYLLEKSLLPLINLNSNLNQIIIVNSNRQNLEINNNKIKYYSNINGGMLIQRIFGLNKSESTHVFLIDDDITFDVSLIDNLLRKSLKESSVILPKVLDTLRGEILFRECTRIKKIPTIYPRLGGLTLDCLLRPQRVSSSNIAQTGSGAAIFGPKKLIEKAYSDNSNFTWVSQTKFNLFEDQALVYSLSGKVVYLSQLVVTHNDHLKSESKFTEHEYLREALIMKLKFALFLIRKDVRNIYILFTVSLYSIITRYR